MPLLYNRNLAAGQGAAGPPAGENEIAPSRASVEQPPSFTRT
jgi:hypothetical protein